MASRINKSERAKYAAYVEMAEKHHLPVRSESDWLTYYRSDKPKRSRKVKPAPAAK